MRQVFFVLSDTTRPTTLARSEECTSLALRASVALMAFCFVWAADVSAQDKKAKETEKEIAGRAEFLRSIPKKYATLIAVDAKAGKVTIHCEGEKAPTDWSLAADAEVKVHGWWGRLGDLRIGDRVWVWLAINRQKQPVAVCMIADEVTQQNLHNEEGVAVVSVDDKQIKIKDEYLKERTLPAAGKGFAVGDRAYVQSAAGQARLLLWPKEFALLQEKQKELQRERWSKEGLPGSVGFVHVFHGEMELMLDHEAMRWARALKLGDVVNVHAEPPVKAVVKHVEPRRDRTLVRVIAAGAELTEFHGGQRVRVLCTPPPREVESALFPPGLDDKREGKELRIDWFMSNIYCTCGVRGEGCTGHFYTLASCNPNACGMPKYMRRVLGEKIDQGKTDRQIMEELHAKQGANLLRPHVLP